ncbi:hypothetical protein OsJ_12077 [Oryza sativa Japonica Group]|uniref:Uncharacterized protein n=1 Tax=Oryza sativa subsp. japonica TaxID=39947 RepID=B9FA95_ORYSJ|nr:hypothetical protein OsJ_12077 [Oryza sativa Japonica Group]
MAALEYALCVNGKPCARPRVDGEPGDRPPPRVDEEPCARLRVVDGEPGVWPRVGDLGGWRSIRWESAPPYTEQIVLGARLGFSVKKC